MPAQLVRRPVAPTPVVGAPAPAAPKRLSLPGLSADVVAVEPVAGVLTPPPDVDDLGWWSGSALPGSEHGTTLLTGHYVHTGGGIGNRLATADPGDPLTIRTRTGTHRYRVDRVTDVSKARLAAAAPRLFSTTGPSRIVVITCSDWNGSGYDKNTVIVAR